MLNCGYTMKLRLTDFFQSKRPEFDYICMSLLHTSDHFTLKFDEKIIFVILHTYFFFMYAFVLF